MEFVAELKHQMSILSQYQRIIDNTVPTFDVDYGQKVFFISFLYILTAIDIVVRSWLRIFLGTKWNFCFKILKFLLNKATFFSCCFFSDLEVISVIHINFNISLLKMCQNLRGFLFLSCDYIGNTCKFATILSLILKLCIHELAFEKG